MAEQYFANKDKDMMAPKAKKASKGPMKKVFVLPRKGQKEYEDVERMGRKVKRVIQVPMKAKEILMTKQKRVYSKGEKAMMTKAAKKLEGLIKKRSELIEARTSKPLTLEEKNIKEQLEEKLKKGMEEAKSPEQKKMEKQMLLALEAAPAPMKMMAIQPPKGKVGAIKGKGKKIDVEGLSTTMTIPQLKEMLEERGLKSTGNKKQLVQRLAEEESKPKAIEPTIKSKKEERKTKKQSKQNYYSMLEEEEEEPQPQQAITEVVENALDVPIQNLAAAAEPDVPVNINSPIKRKLIVTKRKSGKGLVGGGVVGFLKGLASKAIDYVKKDPMGALKQAVNIGKQAYEHGTKAKEMYDKFFKKDKDKGGMLEGFSEPKKQELVHHMYKLNLFNKAMEA
jgi:hypothetical protein